MRHKSVTRGEDTYDQQKADSPFDFEGLYSEKQKKQDKTSVGAKGFFIALTKIFAVLIIVSIVFLSGYIVISGAPQQYELDGFQIEISNFGINPVWMGDGDSTQVNSIYDAMEEKGQLIVAYEMYELACKRLNLSQKYSIRAIGNITTDAAIAGIKALVKVNSNRLENYEVLGEPSLNANQPRKYSNMDINYPVESEGVDWLVLIIQTTSVESIRAYFDGQDVYEQRSKKMTQNEDGEFEIIWSDDHEVLESDFERSYEDHELREKANFVIIPDNIIADSVHIEVVNENGVNRYDVYFELDCENTALGSATYYEAEAIKRKMGKSQEFIFTYMDVSFSVYENGYMTHWTTNQHYRISQDLGPLGEVVIDAHNFKREAISYDPNDCCIVNFLQEQENKEDAQEE